MKTLHTLLLAATLTVPMAAQAQIKAKTEFSFRRDSSRASRTIEQFSKDFGIYIGLNGLGGTPATYDLSGIGSRFVALSWRRNILLSSRTNADAPKLRLGIGPEIAWNNFMLTGNNRFVTNPATGVQVVSETRALDKSKLTVCQFNIPVMLNVAFRSGFTLGAGAYVGARLDSYTKVKPDGGKAERDHNSYNVNPLRFGLQAEVGWQQQVHLFFRYEPNSLFKTGQGPDANVWAVGFRI